MGWFNRKATAKPHFGGVSLKADTPYLPAPTWEFPTFASWESSPESRNRMASTFTRRGSHKLNQI